MPLSTGSFSVSPYNQRLKKTQSVHSLEHLIITIYQTNLFTRETGEESPRIKRGSGAYFSLRGGGKMTRGIIERAGVKLRITDVQQGP